MCIFFLRNKLLELQLKWTVVRFSDLGLGMKRKNKQTGLFVGDIVQLPLPS